MLISKVNAKSKNNIFIMAIHIKLIRNNIKSNPSYGKYFAKAVSQGEVTLQEIAEEACRNSSIRESDVKLVVTELQELMKQRLALGQTVVIDGIGRFSIRVESKGVDNPKDFNIRRHLTRFVCGFLPASHRSPAGNIIYDACQGLKAVWHKGFKP